MSEPMPVGAITAHAIWTVRQADLRCEVIRRSPTRRVSPYFRLAVLRRDEFTCAWCMSRAEDRQLHVDHIQPWSAGGSDDSTNLRTLCAWCNQRRSNYVADGLRARVRAIVENCYQCSDLDDWTGELTPAWCHRCRAACSVPAAWVRFNLNWQREAADS